MKKPLLVKALNQENYERPPVWMMRQAGRYLVEYQKLKEQYSFLELCRSSELAFEVSMLPMNILEPDAAIVFADILLPAEGMGIGIDFNPGPVISNPIKSRHDIESLSSFDPQTKLGSVLQTISALKKELGKSNKAVLGFSGAPWTMACYLCDQGPFKHFLGTQVLASKDPEAMHLLLSKITDVTIDYLLAQIESGADAVQIFDTWAGNLDLEDYKIFALPYVQKIIEEIKKTNTPTVLYANNSSHLISEMKNSGANCLSIDAKTDLKTTSELLNNKISIQGNLDSTALFATKEEVVKKTEKMLKSVVHRSSYIVNLGHGILPRTPRENAIAFFDTAKQGWPDAL